MSTSQLKSTKKSHGVSPRSQPSSPGPVSGAVKLVESRNSSDDSNKELRLTVVVCTHNRYDVLPDALASLREQTLPGDVMELVVVDNSTEIARQDEFWRNFDKAANLRLVLEPVPGLSRARNIGLRMARGSIIAFIDDDALAAETWCEAIVNVFLSHGDAGIAGGPVEPIWSSPRPAWLHPHLEGFFTIVDRGPVQRRLNHGEWLAGTNIAFRRKLLDTCGGFNESLGRMRGVLLSNEELEVTRRIHEAGYFSYYEPLARVLHCVHTDRISQHWLRKRVAWQAVSDLLAADKPADDEAQWNRLADYFYQLPAEMRGMRGLLLNTDKAELFQKQCAALEAAIHILLNSGRDPLEHGE
jgi:glucosyl-dolichyl phosphate glucuronosyltransferase